ncbi:MAG: hypothetical protein HC916_05255 [Coleofasciculaceae cyanobacterium SM2_1_6]|nr:hypothetical protein [Coleofasciculaceae cyanobacterium SM2_1_6]
MNMISEVVEQALKTGYLSIQAEDKLRLLLRSKYDKKDFSAFMSLQRAAMAGLVQQESRSIMAALSQNNKISSKTSTKSKNNSLFA